MACLVQLVGTHELGDLLAAALPKGQVLPGTGRPEEQVEASSGDPIGAAELGGHQLPLADVPVDRFPIHLEVFSRLLRRHDLACSIYVHHVSIISDIGRFVNIVSYLRRYEGWRSGRGEANWWKPRGADYRGRLSDLR